MQLELVVPNANPPLPVNPIIQGGKLLEAARKTPSQSAVLTAPPIGESKTCLSLWERWHGVSRDGEGDRAEKEMAGTLVPVFLPLNVI